MVDLNRDMEKLREEMEKELQNYSENRLDGKKLIELSIKLDEIIVEYTKANMSAKINK